MSALFDNVVQQICSFRPESIRLEKPWVKIILNPQPPKTDAKARALWTKFSLDFETPTALPAMVENALVEGILVMLTVLCALRYKKSIADLDREELTELLDSVAPDPHCDIYYAHKELLAMLQAEYAYLVENETGVAEV